MNFELFMHKRSENEVWGNFTVTMESVVKLPTLIFQNSVHIFSALAKPDNHYLEQSVELA